MSDISLHALRAHDAREFAIFRWEALRAQWPGFDSLGQHRDAHYVFFVAVQGTAALLVDFTEVHLPAGSLYYLLPGQVHAPLRSQVAQGWVVAVAPHVVSASHREVLADNLALQQPVRLAEAQLRPLLRLLELLDEQSRTAESGPFYAAGLHHLVLAFLSTVAGHFYPAAGAAAPGTRAVLLAQQFKQLLAVHVGQLKSPAAYAARLHISTAYLAEVVKKTTGLPVGHWITQQVLLEAKRLLCYTDLDVKQISQRVGLADSAYFARFFRRHCHQTPSAFRDQYRR